MVSFPFLPHSCRQNVAKIQISGCGPIKLDMVYDLDQETKSV